MRFTLLMLGILIGSPLAAQVTRLSQARVPTVMTLQAKDEKTGTELTARFEVEAVLARKKFSGQGSPARPFAITLTQTDTLIVTTQANGYSTIEELMLITCDTCANYEYIALLPEEVSVFTDLTLNRPIELDRVYFDQSSYVLRSESFSQLDKLVRTLVAEPTLKIAIAGHTDNVGDRRLNQTLSENRAKVITNYLVSHGIAENRLQYRGYGDTQPAAPNDSEENRRKNRRVEFVVLAR